MDCSLHNRHGEIGMTPLPHRYDVHLAGGPSGHAWISTSGAPELPTAPPREFDGPGDAWSPEHLLLASVQTCFLFTLRAIAQKAQLEFTALTVDATGTVDRQDGLVRFTSITLLARIVLREGADPVLAKRVLEKSEKACLISASLSTPIHLEIVVIEPTREPVGANS
jgi:peroxiredoxin-like protein